MNWFAVNWWRTACIGFAAMVVILTIFLFLSRQIIKTKEVLVYRTVFIHEKKNVESKEIITAKPDGTVITTRTITDKTEVNANVTEKQKEKEEERPAIRNAILTAGYRPFDGMFLAGTGINLFGILDAEILFPITADFYKQVQFQLSLRF